MGSYFSKKGEIGMISWLWLIPAAMFGGCFGVFAMCIFQVSGRYED